MLGLMMKNKTFTTEDTEAPLEALPQRATENSAYPLTGSCSDPAYRDESELLSRAAGIFTADFAEIPLPKERTGERIMVFSMFYFA